MIQPNSVIKPNENLHQHILVWIFNFSKSFNYDMFLINAHTYILVSTRTGSLFIMMLTDSFQQTIKLFKLVLILNSTQSYWNSNNNYLSE